MSARIDTAAERANLDALRGHTPGPWVSRGRYIGVPTHQSFVGECRDRNGFWSDTTPASDNARLIAAAPDLLVGYRAALDEIDRMTAALAEAEDRGAAQMRDRAAVLYDTGLGWDTFGAFTEHLRALPLRLPGSVQPDETLAWAVVSEDGTLVETSINRSRAEADGELEWHGERIVRVAIRIVEDEA